MIYYFEKYLEREISNSLKEIHVLVTIKMFKPTPSSVYFLGRLNGEELIGVSFIPNFKAEA